MEKLITIINRLGTKKHQLNGVELTSTAIGVEWIGRCRHLPPPILIFLHCNTPISYISQIYSESRSKNNSSIVRVEVTYPSYNSHNTDEIKSIIHNNIPHHIWNCPHANHTILNIIIIINPSVLLGNWNFLLVPNSFTNFLLLFIIPLLCILAHPPHLWISIVVWGIHPYVVLCLIHI